MSTHSPIQAPRMAEDADASPVMQTVKPEPLSPPTPRKNSDARDDGNPMALDKVLSSKNGAGRQHIRRRSGSIEANHPNKRQKSHTEEGSAPAQPRAVLPKPMHTVSSHNTRIAPLTPPITSSLLDKRQSKRKLMIIAPPPGGDIAAGIRSAPLHSNMWQQQQQQQPSLPPPSFASHSQHHPLQQHQFPPLLKKQGQRSFANPPKTASLLQPAHSQMPLLSPKIKDAAKRRHFAIPPIVPSQQQPPQSATLAPTLSNGAGSTSSVSAVPAASSSTTTVPSSSRPGSTGPSLTSTAAATSLPPMTPTTTSFSALQRQQFLQPFEHLFDTIETTRTLKATLDDQIRRSSSLIKTLQTSSATVEGLVRNKIKEVQKEVMGQMEPSLEEVLERIVALEKHTQLHRDSAGATASPSPRTSSPAPSLSQRPSVSESSSAKNACAIVPSHRDSRPDDYNTVLNTLRDRLDRLEKQMDDN